MAPSSTASSRASPSARPPHRRRGGCRRRPRSRTARRSTGRGSWPTSHAVTPTTAHAAVTAAAVGLPAVGRPRTSRSRGAPAPPRRPRSTSTPSEIAIVETVDMGMLHESMRARLVARGAENFRIYADLAADHEERLWSSKGTRNTVVRMPAGPAVVITPWNAPFMLSTWKVAPGARRRQHGDPQAGGVVAAVVLAARRPHRRGRVPAGRVQPRAGHRRGGRPAARRRSPGQADQLHRLARDGPPHRSGGGREHRAVHGRARRQGTADRVRRRRPRRRRGEGGRAVRRLRAGVPRRHPAARRGVGARRVPRPASTRRSTATCSATAATRRRRSPR